MAENAFSMENTKTYINFPNDVYIPVTLLSWRIAFLPPGPLATTNDPVKSAQFLFGGYVPCGNLKPGDKKWIWPSNYTVDPESKLLLDEAGNKVVARKWSRWMRVSNADNSAMNKTFQEFDNLPDLLQGLEDPNGKMWTMGMTILLEQSDKYQNILRIKPDENELSKEIFYDDKYIPYKVTKAYGKLQPLALAGCRFKAGVKTYDPDTMVEPDAVQ